MTGCSRLWREGRSPEVTGPAPGRRPRRDDDRATPDALACLTQRRLPVAIATSASAGIARVRLARVGLPAPAVLVGADDVEHGKPAPDPYLRDAELLGVDPRRCVGVEDSPAGVASLRAAGATAIAVLTTHPRERLAAADGLVPDLAALRVRAGGVEW